MASTRMSISFPFFGLKMGNLRKSREQISDGNVLYVALEHELADFFGLFKGAFAVKVVKNFLCKALLSHALFGSGKVLLFNLLDGFFVEEDQLLR